MLLFCGFAATDFRIDLFWSNSSEANRTRSTSSRDHLPNDDR